MLKTVTIKEFSFSHKISLPFLYADLRFELNYIINNKIIFQNLAVSISS
jgi:hypothetical protein